MAVKSQMPRCIITTVTLVPVAGWLRRADFSLLIRFLCGGKGFHYMTKLLVSRLKKQFCGWISSAWMFAFVLQIGRAHV